MSGAALAGAPRSVLARRGLLVAPALLATPLRAEAKPVILASVSILGDLLAHILGERATIRVLAGPDQDPVEFEPPPDAAAQFQGVALVVRNGLGLEPWLVPLLRTARTAAPVLTATDQMTPLLFNGRPDPFAWQDAQLVRTYVLNIADTLYRVLPGSAERDIRRGASGLMARLARLDEDIRAELRIVPQPRQALVIQHGRLRYFSTAYGVRVVSFPAPAPDGTLSPAEIGGLVRRIRSEGITALFKSSHGSNALMERLSEETGVPLSGPLYIDALSPPDGPAPSYEDMMRYNVRLMVSAMLNS